MNILVTGGMGYIGSHFVVSANQAGHHCIIVDNLSNSDISTLDAIEKILSYRPIFYELDISDQDKLDQVFAKHHIDIVVHFAGLKAVGESMQKPMYYYSNNINGSIVLFETMQKYGVNQIIFSSSATVYDSSCISPISENAQLGCTNPYGWTKLILEKMLLGLSQSIGLKVVNLRYFNPIGVHPSGYIGENPRGIPNNLTPYIMKVATGELEYLQVFGDQYDTIDGTGVRDYIHVVDLVQGHLTAIDWLTAQDDSTNISVNLGTGRGTSVLELVKYTTAVISKQIPYKIVANRPGDIATCFCNPSLAHELWGWKTTLSIEQGLTDMWRYYSQNI